jgi:hypothetical protein
MFPFPIATPQGCDIQKFYTRNTGDAVRGQRAWNKPIGVSHVYMMLIGPGGNAGDPNAGGSGAVTVWYGAAQHIPNSLVIIVGNAGLATTVSARFSNSAATPTALLSANSAVADNGGTAMTANQFTASGFFQSVAGQNGGIDGASATTFLSGGGSGVTKTANYGYTTTSNGFFQLQPIIVGVGSTNTNVNNNAIGCGASAGIDGEGGPGMVLIASW